MQKEMDDEYDPEKMEMLRKKLEMARERGEVLKRTIEKEIEVEENVLEKKSEPKIFGSLLLDDDPGLEVDVAPSYEELMRIVTPELSPDKSAPPEQLSASDSAKVTLEIIKSDAQKYARDKQSESRMDHILQNAARLREQQKDEPPLETTAVAPTSKAALQAKALMATFRDQARDYARARAHERITKTDQS